MPYNRKLATKRYVDKKIADSQWSSVQRVSQDFQNESVDASGGTVWDLEGLILSHINLYDLWTRHIQGTDGLTTYECDYKIKYIRLHIRVATGENETSSAVSQTCRVLLYRHMATFSEITGSQTIVPDIDAMPNYSHLYGEITGLYYDKTQYLHSWATDADTTAGGQVMFKKVVKPMHSNTLYAPGPDPGANNDTTKGCVLLQVVGDDPTGTNSTYYGWAEIGFVVKQE